MDAEAICFDLDDTLYSYNRYASAGFKAAAEYLLAEVSFNDEGNISSEELVQELLSIYLATDTGETFDELISRYDLNPAIIDELVEQYHSPTSPLTPYPETEQILSTLSSSYQIGVITDGRGGRRKLDRLGIESYFDAVCVTPATPYSKADRITFERQLEELGVEPDCALYVGDDPRVDFFHPNLMGMKTVRLCRGRYRTLKPATRMARATHRIPSLSDLQRLLTGVSATQHRGEGNRVV